MAPAHALVRLPVLLLERVNQIVEKYDAFINCPGGKVGITMTGTLGTIHYEYALAVKAATSK